MHLVVVGVLRILKAQLLTLSIFSINKRVILLPEYVYSDCSIGMYNDSSHDKRRLEENKKGAEGEIEQ